MEYLPNGDLQNYLHSPLSEKEARHIVLQVLEGLQFMHDNGFTHRDLKPAVSSTVCNYTNSLHGLMLWTNVEYLSQVQRPRLVG